MANWITDNAVAIGADGTVLTADTASTHGIKFAALAPGSGAVVQLAQTITSGSQATVTFSSIPQTYTSLRVICTGRDTSSGASGLAISLFFNADQTAANYSPTQIGGTSSGANAATTTAASTNGGVPGFMPGTATIPGAYGSNDILIPDYKQTTFFKSVMGLAWERQGATTVAVIEMRAFAWLSTAAITSMTFTAGGTAFLDGSTFTLYGLA